jgi:hypothetical protein
LFNQRAFSTFVRTHQTTDAAWGRPRAATEDAKWLDIVIDVPSATMSRPELIRYCRSADTAEQCFIAVMAWGGMFLPNLRRAWDSRRLWTPIVDRLRADKNGPAAYAAFHSAAVPGLAAPYFTKLIFFCGRGTDPILDQWTGKSMDVLLQKSPGFVAANGHVGRAPPALYQQYKGAVESLARELHFEAAEVEFMLFAGERHPWRTFVKSEWVCLQQ